MNNVFHFIEPPQREKKCSFCKRPESAVTSLIQSFVNEHCICSDCIRHAKVRIGETVVEPEAIEEPLVGHHPV